MGVRQEILNLALLVNLACQNPDPEGHLRKQKAQQIDEWYLLIQNKNLREDLLITAIPSSPCINSVAAEQNNLAHKTNTDA